jgi:hypothetical protein
MAAAKARCCCCTSCLEGPAGGAATGFLGGLGAGRGGGPRFCLGGGGGGDGGDALAGFTISAAIVLPAGDHRLQQRVHSRRAECRGSRWWAGWASRRRPRHHLRSQTCAGSACALGPCSKPVCFARGAAKHGETGNRLKGWAQLGGSPMGRPPSAPAPAPWRESSHGGSSPAAASSSPRGSRGLRT